MLIQFDNVHCSRNDTGFWRFRYLFSLMWCIVHLCVPSVLIVHWKFDNLIMWKKYFVYNIFENYIQWHELSYRRNNTAVFDFDRHVCAFSIRIISDKVILFKILIQSECSYCKDSCSIPVIWNQKSWDFFLSSRLKDFLISWTVMLICFLFLFWNLSN